MTRRLVLLGALLVVVVGLVRVATAEETLSASARVARGTTVTARELAKSMAYVLHTAGGRRKLCSATVVSAEWLLLAAHCVVGRGDDVRVGRYRWDKGTRHRVTYVRKHPSFRIKKTGYLSDLALAKISPPAYKARPIRLNTRRDTPRAETAVYAFGYGVDQKGAKPLVLRKGRFVALSTWRCVWRFRQSRLPRVASAINGGIHLCANERKVGRGMCSGDSGGPLVMKTASGLVQVGINSYRVGKCGLTDRPDVYTRVSRFNWWIESIAGTSSGYVRVR